MANKFFKMLDKRWNSGARVCIGLDSDHSKLPKHLQGGFGRDKFNREIVLATKDLALAYKPNIAFYIGNFEGLSELIDWIHENAPGIPVILDYKRADIGNTNLGYVDEGFNFYQADAVTVNPFFGMEAMEPFLNCKDKGIIVLCRTSNPGAGEFQDLIVSTPGPKSGVVDMLPLYQHIARRVSHDWNYNENCALVVGATAPEQLKEVREIVGDDMWMLIPGYGKQGGDLEASIRNGINSKKSGIIINESSSVIFASNGPDFAQAARARVEDTTSKMNVILSKL